MTVVRRAIGEAARQLPRAAFDQCHAWPVLLQQIDRKQRTRRAAAVDHDLGVGLGASSAFERRVVRAL